MEFIASAADYFLHIDRHLGLVIQQYGAWTYGILFIVIFCETGLVVTPFLPGDSLLFAAGAFAATGSLELAVLMLVFIGASVLGDSTNYTIGYNFGHRFLAKRDSKIFKRKYIEKTQWYYDKYGAKTMIMARFVPIVRTFAPFMAGVGHMKPRIFALFIVIGASAWVSVCVLSGYFFGTLPFVKNNFGLVIIVIILISITPGIIEVIRHKRPKKR